MLPLAFSVRLCSFLPCLDKRIYANLKPLSFAAAVEDASTPLTLFAPTNQALAALAAEFNVTLAVLLQSEALPTVLEYHLVSGLYPVRCRLHVWR